MSNQKGTVLTIAILLTVIFVALFGWWAFTWSTHTLVWLSFMGFSFAGWGNVASKRRK